MKAKTITFDYEDFPEIVEVKPLNNYEDKALEIISKHKVTIATLARYLKIPRHRVKTLLNRLEDEGKVQSKYTRIEDIMGRDNNARVFFK